MNSIEIKEVWQGLRKLCEYNDSFEIKEIARKSLNLITDMSFQSEQLCKKIETLVIPNITESNSFYVILNTKDDGNILYTTTYKEGYMLQGNLYDADKYLTQDKAKEFLSIFADIYKERKFEIITVNKKIFGEQPRFVCG